MTLKTMSITIALMLNAIAATAEPICTQLMSPDTMPKKYKKLAPVLSDADGGWIITNDQLRPTYSASDETLRLLQEIVQEFENRGSHLAILLTPPRPAIAGQQVIDDLAGGPHDFDAARALDSFSETVERLQKTGALVPDLAKVATGQPELRNNYYFKRDTHWTPMGALASVQDLATQIAAQGVEAFLDVGTGLADLDHDSQTLQERGSLSDMTDAVCGKRLAAEVVKLPIFHSGETDLFADGPQKPRIALAGSSYSDRYKKDYYRVAESLAAAFDAQVDNYSVSGGGSIAGIESLVLSGALDAGDYDLVVWELPYTFWKNTESFMRQLLGALRINKGGGQTLTITEQGGIGSQPTSPVPDYLVVEVGETDMRRVKVTLKNATGQKETVSLVRSPRVPSDRQSNRMAYSLEGLLVGTIVQVSLRSDRGVFKDEITLNLTDR